MGVNIIGFNRHWAILIVPYLGWLTGKWIDNLEIERSTMFRDKSALYGKELKPGQPPSWPRSSWP